MDALLFGPELYYLGMALVLFSFSLRRQAQADTDYYAALGLSAEIGKAPVCTPVTF